MSKKTEKKSKKQEEVQDVQEILTEVPVALKKTSKPKITEVKINHSKKYFTSANEIEKNKTYSIEEAIKILKKISATKFVSSVELHINCLEKGIKQNVSLPFGTGKEIKVAVVNDEILSKLEKNIIDFDVLITEPVFMPRLAKFAKILGPKGLMPNPKNGTITTDVEKAKTAFTKGQVQVKTEVNFPLIHQLIGKIDMKANELEENIKAVINAVKKIRIRSVFVKTTMSPALKLDLAKI
jgi:large subunit ribosomal protein L1